ncbi:MAG: flavodoxin family protein [Oscillospiraceae bacterium]|jgi:multimeric flavodoxin WrbA|nr:flavodoxin family protein [Oscillospiraceae bacterium]
MRIIGLNGSPRRDRNTAKMVQAALDGAQDAGADVKLYDLYSLNFKGCASCFECKRLGGESYGKCAINDELAPVLDDVLTCDGFFLGSPIYFGDVSADVRAFLERLWFAGLAYNTDHMVVYTRQIPCRLLFTMNAPFEDFNKTLNDSIISAMTRFIGPTELIEAVDTLQFDDYSKYETQMFNVAAKLRRNREVFPTDVKKAYKAGNQLADLAAGKK